MLSVRQFILSPAIKMEIKVKRNQFLEFIRRGVQANTALVSKREESIRFLEGKHTSKLKHKIDGIGK